MINYSIVMRSVNANLFEINQAKSRIKAAEKAGQAPSSEDVALVATEKQNAFAIAQYADVNKVAASLITSRRVIFTPNTEIRKALAETAVNITCYDRNGNIVKRVISSDDADVEDPEGTNPDSTTPGSGSDSGSDSGGSDSGSDSGGSDSGDGPSFS